MSAALKAQIKTTVDSILALHVLSPEAIRSTVQQGGLHLASRKTLSKTLFSVGKDYRASGRYGRLQVIILLGLSVLGYDFLTQMERAKLLLAELSVLQKFHGFLVRFRSTIGFVQYEEWQLLEARLATYVTCCELLESVSDRLLWLSKQGNQRPRIWVTGLLALAELCFLHAFYDLNVSERHAEFFSSIDGPEDFAEAVSTVLALANERRELDAWDFSYPAVGELTDDLLFELIDAAHLANHVRDVEKHITLFQYSLKATIGNGVKVYILTAPTPEFEVTMRLGYIRSEMGRQKIPLDLGQGKGASSLTLPGMAERFVGAVGKEIAEVRDAHTIFRRLRVQMPLDPEIQNTIDSFSYYEDQSELESLSQDFAVPIKLKDAAELRLTEHLTLAQFMHAFRLLRFFAFVNLALLRPYAETDPVLFFNSLVRIASEEPLLELLKEVGGLSNAAGRDLIALISAHSDALGFYDLQYKPLFKFRRVQLPERSEPPHEYAYTSFLMAMSNMTRNVRVANQLRFRDDGPIFVMAVEKALRQQFKQVVTERRVEDGVLKTDVDVAVLEGDTLYLFECKHSLPPTGIYETRDLWEDIEHGLHQLSVAKAIFENKKRLGDYLAGWFPRFSQKQLAALRIVYCVLSSHRLFSGLHVGDVAIRDLASLNRLLHDGAVGMGQPDGDTFEMHEFTLREGDQMTSAELTRYLSPESLFHKSFEPFLTKFTRTQRFGNLVFARETFLYSSSLEEWIAHMESLGCRRLPDRITKLQLPENLEELRNKIKNLPRGETKNATSI